MTHLQLTAFIAFIFWQILWNDIKFKKSPPKSIQNIFKFHSRFQIKYFLYLRVFQIILWFGLEIENEGRNCAERWVQKRARPCEKVNHPSFKTVRPRLKRIVPNNLTLRAWLSWIPRNFKIFSLKPKLEFLREKL